MPFPWKKPKSGRISRFVSDLQQSPKHGGSLFVETGFPTSLIDLFVKNRDRLQKSSSKRNNKAQTQTAPTRPRVLSPPLTEDLAASQIDESLVGGIGLTTENRHDGDNNEDGGNGRDRGGGCCVLTVAVVKVFVVAVLALSTKKLAVGITISAFALLFLELAVARVFTLLDLCPDAQTRLHWLIGKLIEKKKKKKREEKVEESLSSSVQERKNNKVSFEIIEIFQESRDCIEEEARVPPKERELVLIKEKSKSAKLKSKIVNKIVPKKLRSYKKKNKLKKMKEKEEAEGVDVEFVQDDDDDDESVTEVSSLYSEDRIESEISDRDETGSIPPLLESCEEVEEEGEESGSKVIVLVVIALVGLLSGKVLAIVLTLSWFLILRFVCCKSQITL